MPFLVLKRGELLVVLHCVLSIHDHLLDHLTAYRTCLLGGEVTVVTLLEGYTNLC